VDKKTEFRMAMIENVYLAVLRQCGYDARTFLAMIAEKGGWQTAKGLLHGSAQSGFRGLRRLGRRDRSLEHLVIQPQWCELFTPDEIDAALQRLRRKRTKKTRRASHTCDAPECPLR